MTNEIPSKHAPLALGAKGAVFVESQTLTTDHFAVAYLESAAGFSSAE